MRNLRRIRDSALIVMGVILLVAGLIWVYQTKNFLDKAVEAKGVIIDFVEEKTYEGVVYRFIIQFVDERTGEEITIVTKAGIQPRTYAYQHSPEFLGQEIDILYDPENPHNAMINSFLDIWLGPILVIGLGGIFSSVGLTLLAFDVCRRRTAERLPFQEASINHLPKEKAKL